MALALQRDSKEGGPLCLTMSKTQVLYLAPYQLSICLVFASAPSGMADWVDSQSCFIPPAERPFETSRLRSRSVLTQLFCCRALHMLRPGREHLGGRRRAGE